MTFPVVYLFGCLLMPGRDEGSNDAGLLVLRHENAVLRRQTGPVRYQPGGRLWPAAPSWLIPRRRRAGVFAVTPATLPRLAPATGHPHTGLYEAASRAAVRASRDPQARDPHRDGQPGLGRRRVQGELVKLGHLTVTLGRQGPARSFTGGRPYPACRETND